MSESPGHNEVTDEMVESVAVSCAGMLNWPTMTADTRRWYRHKARVALESPDPSEDTDDE